MIPVDMFNLEGRYELTFLSAKEAAKYFPGNTNANYQKINLAVRRGGNEKKKIMAIGKIWRSVPLEIKKYAISNCIGMGGNYVCLRCNLTDLI